MDSRISVIALFCAALSLTACASGDSLPKASLEIEKASSPGVFVPLTVEIARTEKEQEKGFMERKSIPDGTGMIFAYHNDRQLHFWMKNTPTALSIAFIDSSGVIREIYDMEAFSLDTVSSEHSVRHALEVPKGWFSRAGIGVGDRLSETSMASLSR